MLSRSVVLWVFLGAIFFSPIATGAFDCFPYGLIAGGLMLFGGHAFGPNRARVAEKVALVAAAMCAGVTLCELAARPLLYYFVDFRPSDRFLYRWPPLPLLHRYTAVENFEGWTYGDLAAAANRREWRENRRVKFVTDSYGFRNEPSVVGGGRPLDVIVLGDSFGVAGATSQENTLSSVLTRRYGLNVYNLSISRENPLQEYANLAIESKRLKTGKATFVVWLVFSGNDLDEPYYRELEDPQPRWPGLWTRLFNSVNDFRTRSAVRRLITPRATDQIIERTLIDGRRMLFLASYAQRRSRTAEDVRRHPNFGSLKETLRAMEKLSVDRQLRVVVALVPSKEEVYGWVLDGNSPWSAAPEPSGFSLVLNELCGQHGFRFVDLRPPLVQASRQAYGKSGDLLWWADDSHWNEEGQRVAGAAIYENVLTEIKR